MCSGICRKPTGITKMSDRRSKYISPVEFDGKLFNDGLLHRNSPTANLAVIARLRTIKRNITAILTLMKLNLVHKDMLSFVPESDP